MHLTAAVQACQAATMSDICLAVRRSAARRSQTGRLLGLRRGLRYEQNGIEWCEDALRCLPASPVAKPAAIPMRRKPKAV